MNAKEFKQWFAAHRASFPGIDRQIGEMSSTLGGESEGISITEVLQSWKDTLSDLSLGACLAATKSLAKGNPEYPRFLEDHPRLTRHVALLKANRKRNEPPGPQQVDGLETFECPDCRDWGHVSIFTIEAMRAMRDGLFDDEKDRHSNAIRCHCKWGSHYLGWTAGDGPEDQAKLFFQADRMGPCEKFPTDDDVERLRGFFASNGIKPSPRHSEAF